MSLDVKSISENLFENKLGMVVHAYNLWLAPV
jgi:hypothetical protein